MNILESSVSINRITLGAGARPRMCKDIRPKAVYSSNGDTYSTNTKETTALFKLLLPNTIGLVLSWVPEYTSGTLGKPCPLLGSLYTALREDATVFFVCCPSNAGHMFVRLEATGLTVKRLYRCLTFDPDYRELVGIAATKGTRLDDKFRTLPQVLYFGPSCATEKRIVELTEGIVADPFCTVPHTGLACKYLNRPFFASTPYRDKVKTLATTLGIQESRCSV